MDRINNVINGNIDEEDEDEDDVDCFSTDEFSSSDNDDNAPPPKEPAPVLVQPPPVSALLTGCDQMLPGVTPASYESLNSGAGGEMPNDNSIESLAASGGTGSAAYESIHLLDNDGGADHYDVAETVEEQGRD